MLYVNISLMSAGEIGPASPFITPPTKGEGFISKVARHAPWLAPLVVTAFLAPVGTGIASANTGEPRHKPLGPIFTPFPKAYGHRLKDDKYNVFGAPNAQTVEDTSIAPGIQISGF